MLYNLTAVHQQEDGRANRLCHVPRALSVSLYMSCDHCTWIGQAIVRECYSKLAEEEEKEWNFMARYY